LTCPHVLQGCRMKNLVWVLASLLLLMAGGIGGCSKASGEFAIYLIKTDKKIPETITINSQTELEEKQIISVDDIVSYIKDTHEIELTQEASERINEMKDSLNGKAFAVCVGKKQIYWGGFLIPLTQAHYVGISLVLSSLEENIVGLSFEPSGSYKEDPRSNSEIFQSLKKAGKLK
jgi:hypothetical protein